AASPSTSWPPGASCGRGARIVISSPRFANGRCASRACGASPSAKCPPRARSWATHPNSSPPSRGSPPPNRASHAAGPRQGPGGNDTMNEGHSISATELDAAAATLASIAAEVRRVIVGQSEIIDDALTGLASGGHVLVEGVPGLGKTLLV